MKMDVRRTTPFTAEDYAAVRAFAAVGSPEHEALERLSPVPLRDGSEGSTLRALTLLGMAYVREREDQSAGLAAAYDELAADRRGESPSPAPFRANVARRSRTISAGA